MQHVRVARQACANFAIARYPGSVAPIGRAPHGCAATMTPGGVRLLHERSGSISHGPWSRSPPAVLDNLEVSVRDDSSGTGKPGVGIARLFGARTRQVVYLSASGGQAGDMRLEPESHLNRLCGLEREEDLTLPAQSVVVNRGCLDPAVRSSGLISSFAPSFPPFSRSQAVLKCPIGFVAPLAD